MKNKLILVSILAVVAVLAAACQSAPTSTSAPQPTQASASVASTGKVAEIQIQGFAFSPDTITIPVGTEVKWTNMDSVGHNIVSDEGSTIQSPMLAQGASFSMVFSTPGTYAYHCGVHPKMKGTIVVTQ